MSTTTGTAMSIGIGMSTLTGTMGTEIWQVKYHVSIMSATTKNHTQVQV